MNCKEDERYQKSGFKINEYSFYEQNAVLGVLESRSSYYRYVNSD